MHQNITPCLYGLGDGILELTNLVAAKGKPREVFALHPDAGTTHGG